MPRLMPMSKNRVVVCVCVASALFDELRLATTGYMREALHEAGFDVVAVRNHSDFGVSLGSKVRAACQLPLM